MAMQGADFMGYVDTNLAREVVRLTGWKDKVFARRYQHVVISDEAEAQVERLRYTLANGVKEGLVGRVLEWPGVHSAGALLEGRDLEGTWFDRTKEYAAKVRGESFQALDFAETETVVFEQLPCWKHLSPQAYQQRIGGLIAEIESEAAAERAQTGLKPLGAKGDPAAKTHGPACEDQEVAGSAVSCLPPQGEEGSLRSLWLVRRCVPGRCRKVAAGGPDR